MIYFFLSAYLRNAVSHAHCGTCGSLGYLEVNSGLNESAAEDMPIIAPPVFLDPSRRRRPSFLVLRLREHQVVTFVLPCPLVHVQILQLEQRLLHVLNDEGVAWLPGLGHAKPHALTIEDTHRSLSMVF